MKLTELLKIDESTAKTHEQVSTGVYGLAVYGLYVDSAEDLTPPTWLKEVGILLSIDEEGNIDENVLDVAISYRLAKVKVMIEVPFAEAQVDEDYLMASIATNMQVVLSFLPPEDESEESFLAYQEQIRKVCRAFFKRQNLDQMVMPVTNYLEYLFVNILAPEMPFQVKDLYVLSSYANILGEEKTDRLKDVIREETYAHFGGKDAFEDAAKAIMGGLYKETLEITEKTHEFLTKRKDNPTNAG